MAWSVMTGQEKALVVAFALLVLGLIAALVVGAMRRRRGVLPPPRPTRFVPHWQMMTMLALAALGILAAILVPLVARLVSK